MFQCNVSAAARVGLGGGVVVVAFERSLLVAGCYRLFVVWCPLVAPSWVGAEHDARTRNLQARWADAANTKLRTKHEPRSEPNHSQR